ncbi:MAG: acyl-CoA dehydrogenase family protein [Litorimonas sp.]
MTKAFTAAQTLEQAKQALEATATYVAAVRTRVQSLVVVEGRAKSDLVNKEQRAVHGYAWIDTTYEALKAAFEWAVNLQGRNSLKDVDVLALNIAFGEYLSQMIGGIPMGQNEFIRPSDLSLNPQAQVLATNAAVAHFVQNGNTAHTRQSLTAFIAKGQGITDSFDDETLNAVREQYRRFTEERIVPNAHEWHLTNDLIPDTVVAEMAELGTFGVCIPEDFGGLGLGKLFMCIVTEELSRGWIGAGSLGTRSEIAGELILLGGTTEQKEQWLPKIASGEILPTAVFTEPDVGSDLGSLKTRATQSETGEWIISGAKTWITHAARSDLMTLLARSKPDEKGYAGLSMFLAPKSRGNDEELFPAQGMSGSEIEVLGYRGMREYELGFDDFKVPENGLLGAEQGRGFKQLMETFEGARIQTAARAVGVACRAMELAIDYAQTRKQFRKSIIEFPRVSDKIAMMAVDILLSRELTYFSAREKDKGQRCDIEAGMAKLFAARTAWANADAALQIHGGNGYALEYEISRVLCDARILNIFEGAGEIQAQVVAKGKLVERK